MKVKKHKVESNKFDSIVGPFTKAVAKSRNPQIRFRNLAEDWSRGSILDRPNALNLRKEEQLLALHLDA